MGSIAVFGKGDHIVGGAVQNPAQLFQRVHGDAFVPLEIGDGVCAEAHFIDQRILGNTPVLHSFPQRVIAYHDCTTLFQILRLFAATEHWLT